MYQIQAASESSDFSVRTLQYYDEIGLLTPEKNQNGYDFIRTQIWNNCKKFFFISI